MQGSLTAEEAEQLMDVLAEGVAEGVSAGVIKQVGMLGNDPLYDVESIGRWFGRFGWRLSESQIHDMRQGAV